MDPLSITASVIAVLGLAHKISILCLDLHSLKSARQELNRVLDEVESLRAILQGLARLESGQSSSFETANKPDGPLARCRTELQNLLADLQKLKSSNSKFGLDTISWALNEKDLARRLDRLGRAKQDLQLALSIDQTAVLLECRNDSVTVRSTIERVNIVPFPSSALNDAQKLRSLNTGDWFLKGTLFNNWKKSPRSVLWLNGIPGSGKTVLASSVIEELTASCLLDDDSLLLYFFFDFAGRDKRITSLFLRSILSQIMVHKQETVGPIHSLYDQHHGGFQEPNNRTLLDTLRTTFKETKQIYLVIDAIDECTEIAELLEIVEEICDWKFDNVHMLVTSRREKDIEETFIRLGCEQIRLEGKVINEDIQQYVHLKLKERWLERWPVDIQVEVTSTIVGKAGEMFRLASLQLDELRTCRTLKALRAALTSLPTTLDETYHRILGTIEPEHAQSVLKILSWLCFAFCPPTLTEVAEALAVDLETLEHDAEQKLQDPDDIFSICGSW